MHENEIGREIVDSAYQIHVRLGPGLLESVYDAVMSYELRQRNLHVAAQQPVPIIYDEVTLEIGFRADQIVERKVIVELKSVESIAPVHKKQVLTYLRVTGLRLGYLINFGENRIKDGITHIVNKL